MKLLDAEQTISRPVQATRVFGEEHREIMQIKLKAGEMVKEHDDSKHVFIIVQSGSVEFTVEGQPQTVDTDHVLHMEPYEKHSLKGITDVSLLVFKC